MLSKFEQENERRPSIDEISEQIDLPEDKIDAAMQISGRHVSVDAPFVDGEDNSLLDVLVNDNAPMADRELVKSRFRQRLRMPSKC